MNDQTSLLSFSEVDSIEPPSLRFRKNPSYHPKRSPPRVKQSQIDCRFSALGGERVSAGRKSKNEYASLKLQGDGFSDLNETFFSSHTQRIEFKNLLKKVG